MTWYPITRETVAATQEHLEALLGFDRDTFRASSFLAQGDPHNFCDEKPARRKELLGRVIGLGVWELLLAVARRDKRVAEDSLQKIAGLLEAALAELAGRDAVHVRAREAGDTITRLEKERAAAQTALEQAIARVRQIEQARAELRELQVRRDSAEDRVRALEEIQTAAIAAGDQLVALLDELDTLPGPDELDAAEANEQELRGRCEAHTRAVEAVEAAKREAVMVALQRRTVLAQRDELRRKAGRLLDAAAEREAAGPGNAICRECHQTLGAEALASALASMRVEADELQTASKDLDAQAGAIVEPEPPLSPVGEPPTGELGKATARLREVREAAVRRAGLAERRRVLDEKIKSGTGDFLRDLKHWQTAHAELEAKVSALEDSVPDADVLEGAETNVAVSEARLREVESDLITARDTLTRAQAELDRLDKVAVSSQEARGRATTLRADVDVLTLLERMFSRNGIPALILETTAIPALEAHAQEYLNVLGGKTAGARIELRTQRALKTTDGLAETLDIMSVTSDGYERIYEDWSGGEQMRISLAFRFGLARLLASRHGASRIVILDEPGGDLDPQGKAALIALLRYMHEQGHFDRVYLISHDTDLRDAFDQTITVCTDGERSWIEGAGVEAVAA